MGILNLSLVHDSWKPFLTEKIITLLANIEILIGDDYTPNESQVLRFMGLDLNKVKVVILGQDPYKPKGVANGRAFQPNNLSSWSTSSNFRQNSLKNIIRNIYASYNNIEDYDDIPTFLNIVPKIDLGEFNILPPHEWFDSIEEQGVLLLNTSLTCEIGISNSHKEIWREFSTELIQFIANSRLDLIWFLWGKEAKAVGDKIKTGTKFVSKHPMLCSSTYEDDFLKNRCFRDTMSIINWLG